MMMIRLIAMAMMMMMFFFVCGDYFCDLIKNANTSTTVCVDIWSVTERKERKKIHVSPYDDEASVQKFMCLSILWSAAQWGGATRRGMEYHKTTT